MDLDQLFNYSLNEIKCITKDDGEFFLRDLYKGYVWNRLTVSQRVKLATLFLYNVESGKINNVIKTRKVSKSQKYKKV